MKKLINGHSSILFLLTLITLVSVTSVSFSQETKIRIIKPGAAAKLDPSDNSFIIMELPYIGGEFVLIGEYGEWMKVKLPPNKEGIEQTGYIHSSFVELVKQEPQITRKIEAPQKTIIQKSDLQNEGYFEWKEKLSRVRTKSAIGIVTSVVGLAVLGVGLYYTFGTYKYDWSDTTFHYFAGSNRTPIIIADVVGVAALATGLVLRSSARSRRNDIEEEGKLKGYITALVLPKYRAFGIQIVASF